MTTGSNEWPTGYPAEPRIRTGRLISDICMYFFFGCSLFLPNDLAGCWCHDDDASGAASGAF
jgi:predicted SAM-dependent methyltransferase